MQPVAAPASVLATPKGRRTFEFKYREPGSMSGASRTARAGGLGGSFEESKMKVERLGENVWDAAFTLDMHRCVFFLNHIRDMTD